MQAFELAELVAQRAARGEPYLGFLRVPALHVGLYVLPAGGADGQAPHAEDEVYYVVRGAGTIRVGAEDRPVQAGSVVYVAAGVEHRFHRITEEFTVLVFFSTAPAV
jgi:mannose-6-phosphate isomerase-like protein (cupin superfamily)